jgi:hypothetical protein
MERLPWAGVNSSWSLKDSTAGEQRAGHAVRRAGQRGRHGRPGQRLGLFRGL